MRTITYALSRLRGEQAAPLPPGGAQGDPWPGAGHPCPSPRAPSDEFILSPGARSRPGLPPRDHTAHSPKAGPRLRQQSWPPPAANALLTGGEGAQPEITCGDNMQQPAHCYVLGVEARVPGGLGPCTRGDRLPGIPSHRQGAEA